MSSNDFQLQNVYRYSRKSFKNRNNCMENSSDKELMDVTENAPRYYGNENPPLDPGCSCPDPDGDVANILHIKCPVISLAQQQLIKLIEEADMIICENTRTCRSFKEFLIFCKEILMNRKQSNWMVIAMVFLSLFTGILLGAGTCGTYLGRFNSPLMSCIDSYFIPDTFATIEESFRSIA